MDYINYYFNYRNHQFDVDRVGQAINLLKGRHDFRTFSALTRVDRVRHGYILFDLEF